MPFAFADSDFDRPTLVEVDVLWFVSLSRMMAEGETGRAAEVGGDEGGLVGRVTVRAPRVRAMSSKRICIGAM